MLAVVFIIYDLIYTCGNPMRYRYPRRRDWDSLRARACPSSHSQDAVGPGLEPGLPCQCCGPARGWGGREVTQCGTQHHSSDPVGTP